MNEPAVLILDVNSGDAKVIDSGTDACKAGSSLKLSTSPDYRSLRPIEYGRITDWNAAEALWRHTLIDELHIRPDDRAILMTEAPLTSKHDREKTTQTMFESLTVSALHIATQPELAMCASGRGTTGVVVDSGDGATHVVPVVDGVAVENAITALNIAGSDLTDYMAYRLNERGISRFEWRGAWSEGHAVAREIKERLCYVAVDWEKEVLNANVQHSEDDEAFELPDGQSLAVGNERFYTTEVLFQPSILGLDVAGLQYTTYNVIHKCDTDLYGPLFGNIILVGGNTMFPGLSQRFKSELTSLNHDPNTSIDVYVPPDPRVSVWIGGSIVTSLSTFKDMCVSRTEYDEVGPAVVYRKHIKALYID
ncbi:actin-66 [Coniophora puteana RWD-64-598 SS2]|uniref:Actin-66 n=1 Tax=Coniophora puteana (strain RWD-64-598) TaxID=741705 RepID=A0A5M3MP69_CONPW|nr:actin-66 [Coniophora puteana RWD-64-598 SS2]EIW80830.1 actin-66 [Coniophora puteana RWD-64-598 SS2]